MSFKKKLAVSVAAIGLALTAAGCTTPAQARRASFSAQWGSKAYRLNTEGSLIIAHNAGHKIEINPAQNTMSIDDGKPVPVPNPDDYSNSEQKAIAGEIFSWVVKQSESARTLAPNVVAFHMYSNSFTIELSQPVDLNSISGVPDSYPLSHYMAKGVAINYLSDGATDVTFIPPEGSGKKNWEVRIPKDPADRELQQEAVYLAVKDEFGFDIKNPPAISGVNIADKLKALSTPAAAPQTAPAPEVKPAAPAAAPTPPPAPRAEARQKPAKATSKHGKSAVQTTQVKEEGKGKPKQGWFAAAVNNAADVVRSTLGIGATAPTSDGSGPLLPAQPEKSKKPYLIPAGDEFYFVAPAQKGAPKTPKSAPTPNS